MQTVLRRKFSREATLRERCVDCCRILRETNLQATLDILFHHEQYVLYFLTRRQRSRLEIKQFFPPLNGVDTLRKAKKRFLLLYNDNATHFVTWNN